MGFTTYFSARETKAGTFIHGPSADWEVGISGTFDRDKDTKTWSVSEDNATGSTDGWQQPGSKPRDNIWNGPIANAAFFPDYKDIVKP